MGVPSAAARWRCARQVSGHRGIGGAKRGDGRPGDAAAKPGAACRSGLQGFGRALGTASASGLVAVTAGGLQDPCHRAAGFRHAQTGEEIRSPARSLGRLDHQKRIGTASGGSPPPHPASGRVGFAPVAATTLPSASTSAAGHSGKRPIASAPPGRQQRRHRLVVIPLPPGKQFAQPGRQPGITRALAAAGLLTGTPARRPVGLSSMRDGYLPDAFTMKRTLRVPQRDHADGQSTSGNTSDRQRASQEDNGTTVRRLPPDLPDRVRPQQALQEQRGRGLTHEIPALDRTGIWMDSLGIGLQHGRHRADPRTDPPGANTA